MQKTLKKFAATAMVAGAALAGTTALAAPASAATYNGACGSGYTVVNSAAVGSQGTVFLTYNSSNGYNCAVTVRNSPGSAVLMAVALKRSSDIPENAKQDTGYYTTYAGPVYVHGEDACMDWQGIIGSANVHREGTNCG
ncbi:spore-associated protein A [Actinorugispora endophytica]|uniref:Spore-associated protein A n=1 Tax=Actinorugispora endophytica TaxID=1605990 RepID=A0A4R6V3S3_9ACTN|nr:spore-associated protein A [Actinorugispora endophytica]TDQ55035.1 hypothetical protein EV190_101356 [Actinorugispora endophytica]